MDGDGEKKGCRENTRRGSGDDCCMRGGVHHSNAVFERIGSILFQHSRTYWSLLAFLMPSLLSLMKKWRSKSTFPDWLKKIHAVKLRLMLGFHSLSAVSSSC